jgi:hypothetical protein
VAFGVCCAALAIHGIIFGHTAMAIGGIVFFSLTVMGICGVVFRHGTLLVGISAFRCATPLLVICCTTSAVHSKYSNQSKEECAAKICLATEMEDGSVGGNDGKDAIAMTAMILVQQGY